MKNLGELYSVVLPMFSAIVCVTINSTACCANRVENARSVARSRKRLNHRTKENFTLKPMAFAVKKYYSPREKVL